MNTGLLHKKLEIVSTCMCVLNRKATRVFTSHRWQVTRMSLRSYCSTEHESTSSHRSHCSSLSVCLSVCLSQTRCSSSNTTAYFHQILIDFYRATACSATHGIAVAILFVRLSVRLSDAYIVTKLNDALRIF